MRRRRAPGPGRRASRGGRTVTYRFRAGPAGKRAAMRIDEQIVLVTGGARGLGAEIVRAFAREGARVVVDYRRSEAAAADLVREIGEDRAVALRADVTDDDEVRALVDAARARFGAPITTVVNNALADFRFNGDARPRPETLTWADFDSQLRGTVKATLATTQATLPGMREAGFGRIVNIGTNLFQHPVVPYHDYTAAKAAALSLTRTLSSDLGPDGITVNMVSGGLLRTTDASAATPDEVFDLIASGTPLRRVIAPRARRRGAVLRLAVGAGGDGAEPHRGRRAGQGLTWCLPRGRAPRDRVRGFPCRARRRARCWCRRRCSRSGSTRRPCRPAWRSRGRRPGPRPS